MVWLALFVVLLIIEIITVGLTTIWFAVGALGAFVASLFITNIWIQIIIFLILSLLLLLSLRPIASKYLNTGREKTNVDLLIGRTGIVIQEIDNVKAEGRVKVSGQEWAARSRNDSQRIKTDTQVKILEIKGVKLIVEEEQK